MVGVAEGQFRRFWDAVQPTGGGAGRFSAVGVSAAAGIETAGLFCVCLQPFHIGDGLTGRQPGHGDVSGFEHHRQ